MSSQAKRSDDYRPDEAALQELVAQSDTGARAPAGVAGKLLLWVAIVWSLFQLWYASPLPFVFNLFVLNDTEARAIHLAFAVFLTFTAYPMLKSSPRDHIPLQDWALALVGAFCAGYLYLFYDQLSSRPGRPTWYDLTVAVVGMVLLLEATRRALGPPLMVVALVFLAYVFLGPYAPDVLAYQGASLSKAMSHLWLTTEGVFGIALGVSTSFVFMFVLFGSLLDKAGAGNYFIKVAFSLLGHMRGGPAKAAVLSSGMTGLISGSSIANVVTTGTFTIPLMKRVGFTSEKAGAVEVAASVNGQIMPPVMGAAAFLMVEYVGISYVEVIKHAFLPAIISYIALLYIVHLEALKAGMMGLPKRRITTWQRSLLTFGVVVASLIIVAGAVYYGIGWLKVAFPESASWIVGILIALAYLALCWYGARYPELEMDDPNAPVVELPEVGPTVKSGLHFLLPVVVLVWTLMVERLSPGLSAFYATALMIFILVTQRPLIAAFRSSTAFGDAFVQGLGDLRDGLAAGARNMIGIGVATAAAGIIVGTVTLTGIGLKMTEFVEFISGGYLLLMLIFTAVISLILGMGLPTTANYIVVATLMAPVVVELGAQSGLIVPLIAVHLFVFYFGIMADVTPPVGLASFAAAAVSGGDPIKTGFTAFWYSMRTAALPFFFIFNTQLLLIGLTGWFDLAMTIVMATLAMLVFAAGTMGWFLARSRVWESIALLLVAFTLFRPGFWWDMVYPPLIEVAPAEIAQAAEAVPPGGNLRISAEGISIEGDEVSKTVMLPMGAPAEGAERLFNAGLELRDEEGRVFIDNIGFGSAAEKAGLDFDFEITAVLQQSDRPPRELMWI
ncbi:MAG TPA: TRAP transporter permease, partial [Geminicoccaceae bacterium]|nr:TRAP transporter permease [Geminicoccaceae bacterium]